MMFNDAAMRISSEYDRVMESREWLKKMPCFKIDPVWEISIWPPFMGATIRFGLKNPETERTISVYLDCFGNLGAMDEPYWEIYPASDCDTARFLFGDHQAMMAEITKTLNAPREDE